MTVLRYMQNQRERIRDRHFGDTCVCFSGEEAAVCRSAEEILAEMDALEGLNAEERACGFGEGRGFDRSAFKISA